MQPPKKPSISEQRSGIAYSANGRNYKFIYITFSWYTTMFNLFSDPFRNLLISCGVSDSEFSLYSSLVVISWMFKPAFGFLGDYLFVFGYRVKGYVTIFSTLNAILGFYSLRVLDKIEGDNTKVWQLFPILIIIYFNLAFIDAICRSLYSDCRRNDFNNLSNAVAPPDDAG